MYDLEEGVWNNLNSALSVRLGRCSRFIVVGGINGGGSSIACACENTESQSISLEKKKKRKTLG